MLQLSGRLDGNDGFLIVITVNIGRFLDSTQYDIHVAGAITEGVAVGEVYHKTADNTVHQKNRIIPFDLMNKTKTMVIGETVLQRSHFVLSYCTLD